MKNLWLKIEYQEAYSDSIWTRLTRIEILIDALNVWLLFSHFLRRYLRVWIYKNQQRQAHKSPCTLKINNETLLLLSKWSIKM